MNWLIMFFKHPYSDYDCAMLIICNWTCSCCEEMIWRKEKKEHMKKKKWNMRRKKKREKKWCDWIWCNVTKILRINRKQKMWYKNHHKIFRKDAYVTWNRNMRVHDPHFMFAFMECRPTSNDFYLILGVLVWIYWIKIILVIPRLHVYNI